MKKNTKNKRKIPTDEEYEEFTSWLRKQDYSLCTGNCGIYAYALYQVFERGELYNIDNCTHLLFKYRNKYYDGEHVYTKKELLQHDIWGEYISYGDGILEPTEENYEYIKDKTDYDTEFDFFIKIIKEKLLKEKV